MIILTGGAGFIGSNILRELNLQHLTDIVVIDDINHPLKKKNLKNLKYRDIIPISDFWQWQKNRSNLDIDILFHIGACTDTLENNFDFLNENNVTYSQKLWTMAINNQCPFIYASSAATYGNGELGFSDDHKLIPSLKPLNAYGQSKQDFDLWALDQKDRPPHWVGLKYFNVYGLGEAHKGRMASVIWHFLQQLERGENLKLFEGSHGYSAGEQKRDFVFIEDVIRMTIYPYYNKIPSGIYNVGTGQEKSFNDLANALFTSIGKREIEYIHFPEQLKDTYQPYTCAEMNKYYNAGYNASPTNLNDGERAYIHQFNKNLLQ